MTEQEKLVEEMAEITKEYFDDPYPPSEDGTNANGVTYKMFCERVLSVVKTNIGAVVKLCDYAGCICGDVGYRVMDEIHYKDCPKCHGTGVVAQD